MCPRIDLQPDLNFLQRIIQRVADAARSYVRGWEDDGIAVPSIIWSA